MADCKGNESIIIITIICCIIAVSMATNIFEVPD